MVLAGAQSPEAFRVRVANASSASDLLDLSTVTAASLAVRGPRGRTTWTAEIVSQSASELVLEHAFDAADVEAPGSYAIMIVLTVPGGIRRAGPTALQVLE